MANATRMTRRRLLLIGAAAGFAPAVNVAQTATFRWSGYALGADAYIHIAGLDQREARRICALAMAEIERLENVFSLYRTDSELARLNKTGRLDRPSHLQSSVSRHSPPRHQNRQKDPALPDGKS